MTPEEAIAEDSLYSLVASSKAQEGLQSGAKEAEKLYGAAALIYDTVAGNSRLVKMTQGLAELDAQKYRQRMIVAAGINPEASVDELTNTVTKINNAKEQLRSSIAARDSIVPIRFLDNPIGSIKQSIQTRAAEYDVVDKAKNLELEIVNLEVLNKVTDVAEQISNRVKSTLTETSVSMVADNVAKEAELKAIEARLAGIRANAEGIKLGITMPKERLDTLYDLVNANQRARQLQLALDRFDFDERQESRVQEQMQWQRDAQEQARVEKKTKEQIDDDLAETLRLGYATVGMPLPSNTEIKSRLALLKGNDKEMERIYNMGRKFKATGIPIIGSTPAEALDNIENLAVNLPEIKNSALALLNEARKDVAADPRMAGEKDKDKIAQAINTRTYARVQSSIARISAGDATNPFNIGDLGAFLGNGTADNPGIGELNRLPVSQKILNPQLSAGNKLNDPKIVLALVRAGIQRGDISASQAVSDLSQIYRRANLINQQAVNFLGLGIVLLKDGMMYNADIDGETVDMTNPTALGQWLARDLMKDKYRQGLTKEKIGEGGMGFRIPGVGQ